MYCVHVHSLPQLLRIVKQPVNHAHIEKKYLRNLALIVHNSVILTSSEVCRMVQDQRSGVSWKKHKNHSLMDILFLFRI